MPLPANIINSILSVLMNYMQAYSLLCQGELVSSQHSYSHLSSGQFFVGLWFIKEAIQSVLIDCPGLLKQSDGVEERKAEQ